MIMKYYRIPLLAVLIIVAACFFIIRVSFIVSPMRSNSMYPLIESNDIVVATKMFRVTSLRSGNLIVASIPIPGGGHELTVREIEQQSDAPTGMYYLRAVNTNGLDSRWFGALSASNILGRVIWLIKRN
jgi:signal peptidase I